MRAAGLVALVLAGVVLAGCGGSKHKPATTSTVAAPPGAVARDRWGTTWLCRPGLADNPCFSDLAATVVGRTGATRIERPRPAKVPRVDCFYVYPTVSGQPTINANLQVGLREQEVAIAQASRFSQVCKVYAPVYRQITLAGLAHPSRITRADAQIAYRGVLTAFRDYLAHYNAGRGIVLFGDSQGASILIRLLQQEVDGSPALRRRLVSALLLGGNVTVPKGRTVGGDFAHLPACASRTQTGCIVAYSSFTSKPPVNSQFGRTTSNSGVPLLVPRARPARLEIMCVNPASPGGGTAPLRPYIPTLVLAFAGSSVQATTPWVAFPHDYTAHCESSGDASWLQVTPTHRGAASLPVITRVQEPVLGLHVLDVNIALGDLVRLVAGQSAAYQRRS